MMKRIILCLIILGGVVLIGLSEETPPGVGAASFARIGADACPLAMGGAYVAVNEGSPIAYYNPAQLAKPSKLALGSMYSQIGGADLGVTFQTLNAHGYLGTQTPSYAGIGVGATWLRMEISDIPLWNEDSPDRIEYFTSTSSVFLFSGAIQALDWLAAGASVKIYQERILEGSGDGIGLDIGLLGSLAIGDIPITIGVNSIDLGETVIKWHNTTGEPVNYVPWVNKIGVATRPLDEVLIVGDFDWAVGRPLQEQTIHLGFEFSPLPMIALRGGWNTKISKTWTFTVGMGIQLFDTIDIDYAYLPEGNLGVTHVVSAQLSF
jgi:hypothetical protein